MNGPNEELQEELTELVGQRAAISEVLRAIASSPDDLQPLFDTIIGSAVPFVRGKSSSSRSATSSPEHPV